MLHHRQYAPPVIRSLLDHLEAALYACDSLLAAHRHAPDPHNLLRLELTAIAHVLQAREDMRDLRIPDDTVGKPIALFLAATSCLEEAAPARAAATGLEAAATRLIGGRIAVTILMDLVTAIHDVVVLCFTRHDDAAETACQTPSAISEALVWATSPDGS
ncbi:MAG: hypothetical protein K2X43_13225 [Hyphomonadaceae bacterium]|jgi:hypothetical protein|nr:hypothetical protein [Hyphomonadaceae bacterium]